MFSHWAPWVPNNLGRRARPVMDLLIAHFASTRNNSEFVFSCYVLHSSMTIFHSSRPLYPIFSGGTHQATHVAGERSEGTYEFPTPIMAASQPARRLRAQASCPPVANLVIILIPSSFLWERPKLPPPLLHPAPSRVGVVVMATYIW